MRWTAAANRPDAAPVEIRHRDGVASLTVDQRRDGSAWNLLGTYPLAAGTGCHVRITAADAGYTIADAVRFEAVAPAL